MSYPREDTWLKEIKDWVVGQILKLQEGKHKQEYREWAMGEDDRVDTFVRVNL